MASQTHLEILDVFGAAEFRQSRCPHQCKEVKEEEAMATEDGVCPFTVTAEPGWGEAAVVVAVPCDQLQQTGLLP